MSSTITLCIPTLNPDAYAEKLVDAILSQTLMPNRILIIDSSSSDNSLGVFSKLNASIKVIDRCAFDHGATRNIVFMGQPSDFYIFLTQDAIPLNKYAFEKLIDCFQDYPRCGVAYGRQIADANHSFFAQHARIFNYPPGFHAIQKSENDIPLLGIKTAFCSNSFAAYRFKAVKEINFFPEDTLFGEDTLAAAMLLRRNWSIVYKPDAIVTHAHSYTLRQEFTRYFDVGAFHASNTWFLSFLGKADGEGIKFVKSEFNFLRNANVKWACFLVFFRNFVRWSGYKVGRLSIFLPDTICSLLSQNKNYWIKD
jgi:rhamnosyltransferase